MDKWRRKYHREFYWHVVVCAILLAASFVCFFMNVNFIASVLATAAVVGWVWSIFQAKARLDIFDDD